MYLFFDTETTGLPSDYRIPPEQYNEWPRIIQLAWVVCDKDGKEIEAFCELIKPDGWKVPAEKFWTDKGYSTEKNMQLGVPLTPALERLVELRQKNEYTIGHNLNFDALVMRAELCRAGNKANFTAKKVCTMLSSTKYCLLPKASGSGHKWPKLEELYKILFNEELKGSHDALIDVRATAKCFFELKKRNVIKFS